MKKISLLFFGILLSLVFLLPFSHLLLHHGLTTLPQFLARYRHVLTIWRYSLYTLALLLWSPCVRWFGKRHGWSSVPIQRFIMWQWYMLGVFMLAELLWVHNGIGWLFQL